MTVPHVLTVSQAREQNLTKRNIQACAKWNAEAAKKAKGRADRQRLSDQAKALTAVAEAL